MSLNLYWLQCGGCGGDSMSFLIADFRRAADLPVRQPAPPGVGAKPVDIPARRALDGLG